MKRIVYLLLACVTAMAVSAQTRLVLVEEFTNTGCGPCASWSPVLDSCINYRLGDCIAIKYHSGFPDRNDIYYVYDKEAHQAKVDFYHITGVPTTIIDGQEMTDRSFALLENAISWCMMQPEKCGVSVSKTLDGNLLSVKATVTPYYNIEAASHVRLFVAAIEEHIESLLPYSNGETELNYTMRKMITPVDGYQLAEGALAANEVYTFDGQWDIDFFDNLSELGVVAYVQDMDTKEILATAYVGPDAEGENRLTVMNLYDTPDMICVPNYYGKVMLRNDGANTISSATLNVKVNGQLKQYPWTGHLDYLERDTLQFDAFTDFKLSTWGQNNVEVWFSSINGTDAVSNTRTSAFSNSVQASYGVQLKIYTDKKPEEITWKLYNSAGDVVQEGGPYDGMARKFITVDFNLTDDCYQLEFLDAGSDGIKGASGNGYYQLLQVNEDGKATRIAQGDYDGSVYDLYFNLTGAPQHQQRRLVLFEEFTNTSCDPCAEFSPSLDAAISSRMGDMVAITYHYNFPSPQDPFYLASSNDVMTRAAFYDVSGVPSLRVDGEHVGSWGYEAYLDSYIDGAGQVEPLVDIDTEATITDNRQLNVSVSLLPRGITDGSSLRLFVAAVEERIEWAEPAANGERSWNYVLRKLLPSASGQPLETALTQVTPYVYDFTWQLQNYADETELGLVTFVQDISTGKVLNTVYTPRPTGSRHATKILQVMNVPDRICSAQFSADLRIRNTGREPLTSATICLSVNGQVQQTPWTGHLDYLAIDTLSVPLFTQFQLDGDGNNQVELWLSDLNGTQEESVHKQMTVASAYKAQNAVRLTIMTDNNPEETTWTVYDSAGDVVCQGGPYSEKRKKQVIDLPLASDDCYLLTFEDKAGDGISTDRGYYMLHEVTAEGKTRLLVQDTYSTSRHDVYFSLQGATMGITAPVAGTTTAQPAYDVAGRRSSGHTPIYIYKDHKVINKHK